MKDTVTLMPFLIRLEDGREWRGYARDAVAAANLAPQRLGAVTAVGNALRIEPVVLVIRADEPFVRERPKRHWLLRWLIGRGA